MNDNLNKFILYSTPSGEVRVDVLLENETVWLTQKAMSQLFGVESNTITYHLKEIYSSKEIDEISTTRKIRVVQKEGTRNVNRELDFYNLDAIISVGYRVNSSKATQFRIWATQTLKEYIVKGFVLDDNRLKQGQTLFGKDYFRELLQRVRSIRANERRIYQQITDIFAEYVIVAKNYLQETEIKQLERTVTGYFDYIEGLIERQNTFTMEQLAESVNKFLTFNDYKILEGNGKISKLTANRKAINEYEVFNKTQKIISDFDKQIKNL
tara:strand:- start:18 stop:821 length:804 start_codon:yes stop_codon:yes gene_type:complete